MHLSGSQVELGYEYYYLTSKLRGWSSCKIEYARVAHRVVSSSKEVQVNFLFQMVDTSCPKVMRYS